MAALFFTVPPQSVAADEQECARYLGYSGGSLPDEHTASLITAVCAELRPLLVPRSVYAEFPLVCGADDAISFGGVSFSSHDLAKNLAGCTSVVLCAATIGAQTDARIRRTEAVDSVRAAIMQAAGAMYIESFVDALNGVIKKDASAAGHTVRPRYSPGYGDVPLNIQHLFFSLLPCNKIGLTLMDTLVMAPEKSVTAFIGLE